MRYPDLAGVKPDLISAQGFPMRARLLRTIPRRSHKLDALNCPWAGRVAEVASGSSLRLTDPQIGDGRDRHHNSLFGVLSADPSRIGGATSRRGTKCHWWLVLPPRRWPTRLCRPVASTDGAARIRVRGHAVCLHRGANGVYYYHVGRRRDAGVLTA